MERYDIYELIGEGSFGRVFKGVNKETKDIVALKLIQKTGRAEKELKYLRQECNIQKLLKHKNIIHLLDSFETPEHVVVVTEYAKGELLGLLKKEGNLSVQKVQFIASNLVAALKYLHSRRILHRDIKPQNILIGFDGLAKLCDFGFARTMGIDTYMLTSIKGTPLYMAPEIVEEKPYDHNADLWSLGCILYELIVGTPPFCTTSLIQLVTKIRTEPVYWPEKITGDCKSFLQGLLEKNPKKRLTWPELVYHPFVRDFLHDNQPEEQFSLTKALSPSQELAKEKQRQHLQKKLAGYSKLLIKTAKKLEEAQKELKRCSKDIDVKRAYLTKASLSSEGNNNNQRSYVSKPPKSSPNSVRPARSSYSQSPTGTNHNKPDVEDESDNESDNSMSSSGTMTSTSSSISDVSDDGRTVILDRNTTGRIRSPEQNCAGHSSSSHGQHNHVQHLQTIQSGIENLRFPDQDEQDGLTNNKDKSNSQRGSDMLWKSGALFTLHSFGSEDKPIESEEWIDFVGKTMKEVQENPESLCEKHFLTVLVAPLRNHLAGAIVIEKIATLLSMPFILTECKATLQKDLELMYLEAKVLPNLLYSCKLMVRRRRIERNSLNLNSNDRSNDMVNILEEEDFDGMDKSMRLITYLVHIQKDFVLQFCDSVCVLQAYPIFVLLLRLDKKRPRLTIDMLSILCQLLRVLPSSNDDSGVTVVDELLFDYAEGADNSDMIRLLSDSNTTIQSKAIRLLGYLIIYSERAREQLIRTNSQFLWKILNDAFTCSDNSVVKAAEFTASKLKQFIPYDSQRSSDDITVSQ